MRMRAMCSITRAPILIKRARKLCGQTGLQTSVGFVIWQRLQPEPAATCDACNKPGAVVPR
jgi:hypothetical protein